VVLIIAGTLLLARSALGYHGRWGHGGGGGGGGGDDGGGFGRGARTALRAHVDLFLHLFREHARLKELVELNAVAQVVERKRPRFHLRFGAGKGAPK